MSSTATATMDPIEEAPVQPGQVLEDKFRVERIVGEGAMGLVVEATHLQLDERVALKFLQREARAKPDIVARFAREARAAARIKSDHVARVFDVGGTRDGTPFIVMELLAGTDLEALLLKGPVPTIDAVEYVIQACEGLAAAHAQGIVHRDIKPGNLFVTESGGLRTVKLLDFGISKAGLKGSLEDIDLLSADTTQIMGSPHYMSPEQIRSTKDVDQRADIWSLGVVLFELVTGHLPFPANEITGIIAQVLHEPHQTVRSLRNDVPAGLEEVIDNCLIKDPARRYSSAAELAVALLPFAPKRARAIVERATAITSRSSHVPAPDSLPPPATPSFVTRNRSSVTTPAATLAVAPTVPVPRPSIQPEPTGRNPLVWIALAAVMLGLGGGTFAFLARFRGEPASTPPAATASPVIPSSTAVPPSAVPTAILPAPTEAEPAPVGTTLPARTPRGAPGTATTTTASPTARLTFPARPPLAPANGAVPASPRASASSRTAPGPENEIRHER